MPKASPALQSWNAGELSPHVLARSDLAKYAAGSVRTENFIPLLEGPAERRPGTRFVAAASGRAWLTPFQFDLARQYVLEWTSGQLRFYFQRTLLAVSGIPVSLPTPYTEADLQASDGTLALSFVQSADVIYIAHPNFPLYVLSRTGATSFTLAEALVEGGPFEDLNTTGTTLTASAQSGTVTITASAPVFDALDAPAFGRTLVYFEADNGSAVTQWSPGVVYGAGALVRVGDRIYQQNNGASATSGTITPSHTVGARFDGTGGSCLWLYLHSGWGYGYISAVASATSVTLVVQSYLPSTSATTRWALSLFRKRAGFASAVALHRQRLVLAGRQWLALSVVRDFLDFRARDADVQSPDQAVVVRLDEGQMDDVLWLSSQDVLLVGTRGSEYAVGPLAEADPLGSGNIAARIQSSRGSSAVAPLKVDSATLFVQRGGRRVRDTRYEFERDRYQTTDLTRLARHVCKPAVVQMVWAQEPFGSVFAVRADGVLLTLTYDRDQDVVAWARHPRQGLDRSVAVIVAPDGRNEDVYLAVERVVDGATRWHIEVMAAGFEAGDDPAGAWYVDAGLEYDGAPATVLSGLNHLEGETVSVWADASVHPDRVVSGGQITLNAPASRVIVGLAYTSVLKPTRIEAGAADGTAQGKTRRASKLTVKLLAAAGVVRVGREVETALPIQGRLPATPMGAAEAIGDLEVVVPWPGGYSADDEIVVVVSDPVPATLSALYPQTNVQDAR
jgi:hypothetical protein